MKYTPYSIKNQDFNRSVRGYDKDEVKAFLEKLSDEFERLQADNIKLNKKLEEYKEQIIEFKKIEKNLQSTLLTAQESSSKAIDSAKKQTALLMKEAELKAQQLIEKAQADADFTRNSVLRLREEKKLFISRLRAMVDTQQRLLEMDIEKIESKAEKTKEGKETPNENEINVDHIVDKYVKLYSRLLS